MRAYPTRRNRTCRGRGKPTTRCFVLRSLPPDRRGFLYHESTNADIGGKSMHFPHIHQRNRSKGQHMQKAEMSVPRIAPKKKAAKVAKADTVTLRHLAVTLAESHGVPKSQVNAMLMGMV